MISSHSEYGSIKEVYLKTVEDAFVDQQFIDRQWRDLNYLGAPQFDKCLSEYRNFESILKKAGADIKYFSKNIKLSMDAMYCRDASIATDYGMILCNMGKEARKPEPSSCRNDFLIENQQILGEITAPGTIEGGDLAWLDFDTLAIGRTYRTNDEGIRQIKDLLEPKGVKIVTVDLPHYKGPSDVFHLMSILSPIDKNLAVIYSPLMPITFRDLLVDMGYKFVEVPDEEFDSMACNVLALGPRKCLMVEGNPITKSRLEECGASVLSYRGEEISVKGGGGPTCLTRPIRRVHR